uniref:Cytochrome P450 n=1 Tax=Solanum tuberosum TaxID=4113 RepID=M1BRH3_SOLTU
MKTYDLAFCGRPSILGKQKLSYNNQDIATSPYNDHWKELRKICVSHLFSLKKVQSFIPIREDEVSRMIKEISQQAVTFRITNLSSIMISLTTTIICRVAFGIRYDEETREMRNFNELLKVTQEMLTAFFVSDYFPLLGWIDKLFGKTSRLEKNFKDLDEFYEGLIEKHLNPNRPKSMEEDIIDLLLQLKKEKSTPIDLTLDNIKVIIMNMLVAGTDTTASTIIWAMTALIANPNAMKKVQAEIRESVGKNSIVNEDNVQKLQYFKAVIKETFRLDPEIWKNSKEFIPERFLNNDNIDFKGQDFELIPFGAGRRGCLAIALGVANVELVLSNLLYTFDWELPRGMKREDIDTDSLPGITPHMKKHLCLVPRNYHYSQEIKQDQPNSSI